LAQNHGDFHAIVIDDAGPAPEAGDLVHSYRDARLRYRRNAQNLGLAGNWNACLDTAETELVTILHADDELMPGYGARMLAAARHWPAAAAYFCRARIIGPNSQPAFSLPDLVKRFLIPSVQAPVFLHGERGLYRLLIGNFIMCPTLCYRQSRIHDRRFAARWRMVLDLDFTTRLLLAGETLVGLPEIAYAYRRHAANQTSLLTATSVRFEEEIALYEELAQICSARKWFQASSMARRKTIVQLNLAYCALQDFARIRLGSACGKIALLKELFLG
jgi:glycosyltransferase involved in cell wall biosynthesis